MKIENDVYEKGSGICYRAMLTTESMKDEELLSAVIDYIINDDTDELQDFIKGVN